MGKPAKSNKKRSYNEKKSVAPEVFKDNKAENLLSFKKKEYAKVGKDNKARNRKIDMGLIVNKKKPRVYTEKELGIPKLNTALNPVGVAVKGKKGKKFVTEDKMALILAEVNESQNAVRASKLEKSRQLEEIRDIKRKEIEEKEEKDKARVERKKDQIKHKGKNKAEPATAAKREAKREAKSQPPKRKVRFA